MKREMTEINIPNKNVLNGSFNASFESINLSKTIISNINKGN